MKHYAYNNSAIHKQEEYSMYVPTKRETLASNPLDSVKVSNSYQHRKWVQNKDDAIWKKITEYQVRSSLVNELQSKDNNLAQPIICTFFPIAVP